MLKSPGQSGSEVTMDPAGEVPDDLSGQNLSVAAAAQPVQPIHHQEEVHQIGDDHHSQVRGHLEQGQGHEVAPSEAMNAIMTAASDQPLVPQVKTLISIQVTNFKKMSNDL